MTHAIRNDYVTWCGIDILDVPDDELVAVPTCPACLQAHAPFEHLTCIIREVEGARSLLCYKHVIKTVFGATEEASA